MYGKIVVGHDLNDGGGDALALGRLIAEASRAELVVAGIFPIGTLPRGFEARWREQERASVEEIQTIADQVGAEAEAFPSSSPARGLHELAEEIEADLTVVGSSRHSKVGQILAGNVGLTLLHGSSGAVAIAPRDFRKTAPGMLDTITVGFDGTEESRLALEAAVDLARASDATVKLVAVAEPPPNVYGKGAGTGQRYQALNHAMEERLREQLDSAVATISERVRVEASLVSGDPAEQLADAGSQGLLILGSRAYGPLRRVLLGSVSSALVRSAPCPVIVHPRGTKVELDSSHSTEAGRAA